MKIVFLAFLVVAVAVVGCNHLIVGTNVLRPMVYHKKVEYSSTVFRKRVENLFYMIPSVPQNAGKAIKGIMAYDLKNSEASANITQGGIGFNFVNLRMKSERGHSIKYDVYIYV